MKITPYIWGVQGLGIDLVQFIRRSEPRDDCLCPEGVVSRAARWWLLSFGEQRSADHSGKLLRFLPSESGARTGAVTPLLDRKSGSATCLLIARGSHDRQTGGHSRFARTEQRYRCR